MKKFVSKDQTSINNRKMSYMDIDRYPSVPGLIAIILGGVIFVAFLVLCVVSYLQAGVAGMWIGVLGLLLLVSALVGICISLYGLRDPEAKPFRSVVGLAENVLMFLVLLVLYVRGF